jgi:hypothetical protein
MTDDATDLKTAVFAKTAIGQQEIQSRVLGLPPKMRSVLILVDGKRTGNELTAQTGTDSSAALDVLIAHGCIERLAAVQAQPEPAVSPVEAELSWLPPAETRSPRELDMARNFMTNTINTMFGQNMRLTLIEAIHASRTVEDLRLVYPAWVETMTGSSAGAKRLPELREKLFAVL